MRGAGVGDGGNRTRGGVGRGGFPTGVALGQPFGGGGVYLVNEEDTTMSAKMIIVKFTEACLVAILLLAVFVAMIGCKSTTATPPTAAGGVARAALGDVGQGDADTEPAAADYAADEAAVADEPAAGGPAATQADTGKAIPADWPDDAAAAVLDLQKENAEILAGLEACEKDLQAAEKTLEAFKRQNTQLRQELNKAAAEGSALADREAAAQLAAQLGEARKALDSLRKANVRLNRAMDDNAARLQQAVADLQHSQANAAKMHKAMQGTIDRLHADNQTLAALNKDLQGAVAKLQDRLERAERSPLAGQVAQLRQANAQLVKDNARLSDQLRHQAAAVDGLQRAVADLQGKLRLRDGQLADMARVVEAKERKIRALEEALEQASRPTRPDRDEDVRPPQREGDGRDGRDDRDDRRSEADSDDGIDESDTVTSSRSSRVVKALNGRPVAQKVQVERVRQQKSTKVVVSGNRERND